MHSQLTDVGGKTKIDTGTFVTTYDTSGQITSGFMKPFSFDYHRTKYIKIDSNASLYHYYSIKDDTAKTEVFCMNFKDSSVFYNMNLSHDTISVYIRYKRKHKWVGTIGYDYENNKLIGVSKYRKLADNFLYGKGNEMYFSSDTQVVKSFENKLRHIIKSNTYIFSGKEVVIRVYDLAKYDSKGFLVKSVHKEFRKGSSEVSPEIKSYRYNQYGDVIGYIVNSSNVKGSESYIYEYY